MGQKLLPLDKGYFHTISPLNLKIIFLLKII